MQFSYQWLDHLERAQNLRFSLDKQLVTSHFRNKATFKPKVAQRHVYIELVKAARQVNPKEAHIDIIQKGDRIETRVRSRSQDAINKWQESMQEKQQSAFNAYLDDNYYRLHANHVGQTGVIPDHIRYIQDNRNIVLPVAQAVYNKLPENSDTRDYVNLLLSWVQSIPYNTLESRLSAGGSGFFPPVEVLSNNIGDCDSKATLTAALMRSLLPNLSMAIIYLPDHALLAVNLSSRKDEQTVDVRGADHILIDPTGPAKLTMGYVSEQTKQHLANGSYTYLVIP